MNWEGTLATALGTAFTSGIIAYLYKTTTENVMRKPDGFFELKPSKFYWFFGIIWLVMAGAVLIWIFWFPDKLMLLWLAITLVFGGGFGMYMILFYLNYRLRFDEETIFLRNLLGKESSLKWNEIRHISYGSISSYVKIQTKNRDKMKITYYLTGFKVFVAMMELKTQWTAKELKLPMQT